MRLCTPPSCNKKDRRVPQQPSEEETRLEDAAGGDGSLPCRSRVSGADKQGESSGSRPRTTKLKVAGSAHFPFPKPFGSVPLINIGVSPESMRPIKTIRQHFLFFALLGANCGACVLTHYNLLATGHEYTRHFHRRFYPPRIMYAVYAGSAGRAG